MDREPGRARTGVAALTNSERRIALLAMRGKTNRAIAAELFVQLRTVEIHLTNAYRKLGIRRRGELGSVLRPAIATENKSAVSRGERFRSGARSTGDRRDASRGRPVGA
ncbi:hypothetical protein Lesp02_11760 [Lentzea sp. NBRC 105346]|nr:hypothetical protein Lesp02_11760 [Lentzea sp. NBRC 105346]